MEDGNFTFNTKFGTPRDDNIVFNIMDQLLYDGCYLETTNGSNFWQPTPSTPSNLDFPACFFPTSQTKIGQLNPNPHHKSSREETERSNFSDNPPPVHSQMEELEENWIANREAILARAPPVQSESFRVETERCRRLWTAPSGNPKPNLSIKKKLMWAVEYLKVSTEDREILIQIWVPVKRGGRYVLTTNNQPFSLDPNSKSLADYRNVSRRYQFAAEEDSKELVGLPGRVFLKKLPEWTPDVRFFRKDEYPRVDYAQKYNIRGSLALPIFERGSGTCLGVVEIVTTTSKLNYHTELENVCKTLEAFDLRSFEIFSPPKIKEYNESYQAVLTEIQEVFISVCDTHGLPLAQTWSLCCQHDKGGCRHTDENYAHCVSTVDSACYVRDPQVLGFHEVCSEHHLLRGEGVAGGAFMTNQPCFSTDITALSKTDYPLSHHARILGLRAAVAIRLRSVYTGSSDFVLEFFLPSDCLDIEEQKQMLDSLSSVIQQVCRSLRIVTDQELEEETVMPVREMVRKLEKEDNPGLLSSSSAKEPFQEVSSWIAYMMEAQCQSKGVAVSLQDREEEPKEEFKMTTHWKTDNMDINFEETFSESTPFQQDSGAQGMEGSGFFSSVGSDRAPGARKAGEKGRMKIDKPVSLQELRQYFAGSLKDAAKSIGVCPTTLKRICRQHGIARWPSRKIKKVGHSLRKLQLVIDSVQGAEGSIQLASFYSNFPELRSSSVSGTSPLSTTSKMSDPLEQLPTQPEASLLSPGTTYSKSASSSCSHSSGSCSSCPNGGNQSCLTTIASGGGDALLAEQPSGLPNRERSDAELHESVQMEKKLLANFIGGHPFDALPTVPKSSSQILREGSAFKVKVAFGEEKIRFSMQNDWGYGGLLQEVARRFNVEDVSRVALKYLDDDSEWVLLTCDADLEECIDILRSSRSRTIRLSIHILLHMDLGSSFGSTGPS